MYDSMIDYMYKTPIPIHPKKKREEKNLLGDLRKEKTYLYLLNADTVLLFDDLIASYCVTN